MMIKEARTDMCYVQWDKVSKKFWAEKSTGKKLRMRT
jgi:hypothetical protein